MKLDVSDTQTARFWEYSTTCRLELRNNVHSTRVVKRNQYSDAGTVDIGAAVCGPAIIRQLRLRGIAFSSIETTSPQREYASTGTFQFPIPCTPKPQNWDALRKLLGTLHRSRLAILF